MDKSGKYYANWKKADTDITFYDSIGIGNRLLVAYGWKEIKEGGLRVIVKTQNFYLGLWKYFKIHCSDGVRAL
jgi:hypothetical protein